VYACGTRSAAIKGKNRLIIEDYAVTVLRPLCGVSQKYIELHIMALPVLSGERAGIVFVHWTSFGWQVKGV
jgi:hypothetical protein